jgi:hypothetical protein
MPTEFRRHPEAKALDREFAIIIAPPNVTHSQAHEIWLAQLTDVGTPIIDKETFVLAGASTLEGALNYSRPLAKLLNLRVIEVEKT